MLLEILIYFPTQKLGPLENHSTIARKTLLSLTF